MKLDVYKSDYTVEKRKLFAFRSLSYDINFSIEQTRLKLWLYKKYLFRLNTFDPQRISDDLENVKLYSKLELAQKSRMFPAQGITALPQKW